jgi:hypothetical protein
MNNQVWTVSVGGLMQKKKKANTPSKGRGLFSFFLSRAEGEVLRRRRRTLRGANIQARILVYSLQQLNKPSRPILLILCSSSNPNEGEKDLL